MSKPFLLFLYTNEGMAGVAEYCVNDHTQYRMPRIYNLQKCLETVSFSH
ncbi:hypothetical protein Runsl_3061 [Runella slithyformis DSM 19594]|uniref:Uncharacterized protein n=1 Tax=Runella slithyformis (strain ATCC 29530 / DSM 19594 / LMG 11500 / NCIMB 11436 / LSU 4) TaxID=761193 RepID=A0A7U3ZLJ8_RUNSL|nr:hypothetical protein Runsl_3061 [Runella slithyformis DSM 19594]